MFAGTLSTVKSLASATAFGVNRLAGKARSKIQNESFNNGANAAHHFGPMSPDSVRKMDHAYLRTSHKTVYSYHKDAQKEYNAAVRDLRRNPTSDKAVENFVTAHKNYRSALDRQNSDSAYRAEQADPCVQTAQETARLQDQLKTLEASGASDRETAKLRDELDKARSAQAWANGYLF